MLELPGLISGEDTKEDVQALRRYLGRLIPELEQQLMAAQQDNYQDELNKRVNHVTGVNNGTTAGALAEHVRDFNNPHRVTLSQLGFSINKLISLIRTDNGTVIRIGDKKGLQLNFQTVETTVNIWKQHGGTAHTEAAVQLGEWDMAIPELMTAQVTVTSGAEQDVWAGALKGATGRNIGSIELFTDCAIDVGEGATNDRTITDKVRTVQIMAVGMGVFGYGD